MKTTPSNKVELAYGTVTHVRRTLIPAVSIILVLLLPTFIAILPAFQPVTAQQQTSGTFSDDFSTDTGAWQYLGSAYRDPTNQYMVLTTTANSQGGAAFFKAAIQGSFTANFRYKAGGGGWQGDGFTMFFFKEKYTEIGSGGSLGFTPDYQVVPGYGIEFDAWQNIPSDFQKTVGAQANPPGDPSGAHIALIEGFVGDHLTSVDDSRVADDNWHSVTVDVQASSVSVSVDQGVVLQWSGPLNRTFDGFGFSGGTGDVGTNSHLIDDVSIASSNLQTPLLTTSCISSGADSSSSFAVRQISGDLSFNGEGISDAPIWLSYSVTGGQSWQDLTSVYTGADGNYSAVWLPTVSGSYQLKAVFQGDANHLETSTIINFTVEPNSNQSTFASTSNPIVTTNPAYVENIVLLAVIGVMVAIILVLVFARRRLKKKLETTKKP